MCHLSCISRTPSIRGPLHKRFGRFSLAVLEQSNEDSSLADTEFHRWQSDRLVVEVDGDFLIFPISNIRYFQLSIPGMLEERLKLPSHTIYGASIVR